MRKRGRPCKLCDHMGQIDQPVNLNSKRTCQISGGSCQSKNVIYGAECAKHNLLYVGFTSTTLSQRFNKHRSDSKFDPTATELSKTFMIVTRAALIGTYGYTSWKMFKGALMPSCTERVSGCPGLELTNQWA